MLYATVRNRKISVKKPTTIPKGSQNVDTLQIDFDEEWDGLAKSCVFVNHYVQEEKTQRTVTTVTTTTETKNADGEVIGGSSEKTETTTVYDVLAEGDEELKDTEETITEVNSAKDKDGNTTITTTKTTNTVDKPVVRTKEADVKVEVAVDGNLVNVPWECLEHVGQLSISIVGVNSDNAQVMTTVEADSFWEVLENGEDEGDNPGEATPTLVEQLMTASGKAEDAAKHAENVATDLSNKAASGAFNGKDGKAPQVSVGTVETTAPGGEAEVTASGTSSNVKLNFKLPRGQTGENGKNGFSPVVELNQIEDAGGKGVEICVTDQNGPQFAYVYSGKDGANVTAGYSPVRGKDYWTEEDKEEIKTYINQEIGGIEIALDRIIAVQESYIAQSPVPVNEEVEE